MNKLIEKAQLQARILTLKDMQIWIMGEEIKTLAELRQLEELEKEIQ